MKQNLLGLDVGTTGVTACLFDSELRLQAKAYAEFPQRFPAPGWVEHDGPELLAAVDLALGELLDGVDAGAWPSAMGLTNQRETVFAMERASGRPIGRGIVWQDRRTEQRCRELREAGHAEWVRARTGLLLDPYFSATKIQWICEEDPSLRSRAEAGEVLFGTVDTLVLAHLTGGASLATDPTNASRTLLFDLEAGAWDAELCALFGTHITQLAEVRPSRSDFGLASSPAFGGRSLPILGVAGDQQAALFGQGCVVSGDLKCTLGTGAFLLLHTGTTRSHSKARLLSTVALGPGGEAQYALEGSIFVAGAAIQWLRDGLGVIDSARDVEALAASVPDSGGVHFVPAFAGLGAPHWDAGARGAILGLTRGTTRAHIARAALEAIAFQTTELIELLRAESGLSIDKLRADGGVASNDLCMQWLADLAGLSTLRAASIEATARGAAGLAGVGAGIWESPCEAAFFGDVVESFEPAISAQDRAARLGAWSSALDRIRSKES